MARFVVAGLLASLVLLAGCARVTVIPNPFSSPETEQARLTCLATGGLWMETTDRYACQGAHAPHAPKPPDATS